MVFSVRIPFFIRDQIPKHMKIWLVLFFSQVGLEGDEGNMMGRCVLFFNLVRVFIRKHNLARVTFVVGKGVRNN